MYVKLVENRILDSTIDFLDDHLIDTSGLRSRQETILNNGVIVTGGSVEAQNFTVGGRAKSVINNMAQTVSSMRGTNSNASKN